MRKISIKIILIVIYILILPYYLPANSESDCNAYSLDDSTEQTREERKDKRQARKAEREAKKEAKKQKSREQQEVKSEVKIHNTENKVSETTEPSSQRVTSSTSPTRNLNKSANRNKNFVPVSQSSKMTSEIPKQSNSTKNQGKPISWVLLDSKSFWISAIVLFILLSIVASGYSRRCRRCGKWWAMRIIEKELLDEKASTILKKDDYIKNERTGKVYLTQTTRVPATIYKYRIDRRCKHCGHEDYLIKEEKREN